MLDLVNLPLYLLIEYVYPLVVVLGLEVPFPIVSCLNLSHQQLLITGAQSWTAIKPVSIRPFPLYPQRRGQVPLHQPLPLLPLQLIAALLQDGCLEECLGVRLPVRGPLREEGQDVLLHFLQLGVPERVVHLPLLRG